MKAWSLNAKMAFVICILIAGSVIISGTGLTKMSEINGLLTEVTEVTAKRIETDLNVKALFYIQVINERNYVIDDSPAGRKTNLERIQGRDKELRALLVDRRKIADENGLKSIDDFEQAYENWLTVSREILALADAGDQKGAIALSLAKGRQLRLAVEDIVDKMVERNIQGLARKTEEAHTLYANARSFSLITTVVSILFGVSLGFIILRALAQAVNKVISTLTDNSNQVTTAAHQIAAASEELSQASTEQASSLEETVATLEELTSMVKINSENAKEAAKLSESTQSVAFKGEQEIRALVQSMGEISADSKKIEDIINVIDDIAFQTNLLALNAAVEAARAGEQGKGFAVVAEAVRNLAQRSASAAKDITDLIKGSVQKIEVGTQQAGRGGQVLGEIVSSVKKVSELNAEIANAGEEQFNGINQIGKAMNQLDQVTQINAATSEEAAASAQELSAQATHLTQTVDLLVTTIKGANAKVSSHDDIVPAPTAHHSKKVVPFEKKKSTAMHRSDDESQQKLGDTVGF
ncbi:methyl-accepting chemotaxis protein [Bdellovibrio sp. HCB2-146]|uniref:methyl-accepting chemotaxis protein n=1 Tax=Bdellovibrio sp. HCB2-146 TaxID=3394362 RepID=UPI0039BD30FF